MPPATTCEPHERSASTQQRIAAHRDQLNSGALSLQLDDEVMERLDRTWPGPGEASQAYAG
ncbi:hypothetical protein [Streptomyces africanus]|uniref:hypothetical protein n=1 Tax=Streptomyces africanus TaxID=231024 RepID=UPI00118117FA|nr:hypothetical protein [Streptomyces africanus]